MSNGYIKLDRGIMNHWLWEDKPYAKGQAWVDLLLLAVWKESKELYHGKLVQRKPGEVSCSIEWLAERWGWNRKKVMRFLDVLEVDEMVTQSRTPKGTTVTIVNWEKYQVGGTTVRTTDGTPVGQLRDNYGTTAGHTIRKDKKEKESSKNGEEYNTEPGVSIPAADEIESRLRSMRERITSVSEDLKNGRYE